MLVFIVCLLLPFTLMAPSLTGKRPNTLFIAYDDFNDWVEPLHTGQERVYRKDNNRDFFANHAL